MRITDARTGARVVVRTAPIWRPIFGGVELPYKWELTFAHSIDGNNVGRDMTDIYVYASGRVSWPGREVMFFDTAEAAKQFVEVTYALEEASHES